MVCCSCAHCCTATAEGTLQAWEQQGCLNQKWPQRKYSSSYKLDQWKWSISLSFASQKAFFTPHTLPTTNIYINTGLLVLKTELLLVTFVQHAHLFAVVYHTYKTLNGRQKRRGDERLALEVWGVSHTQLSRSFLNFSWKTPPPSHQDLFLQVTSGPSQNTQVKHKFALFPIRKPCASLKLTLLNLQPSLVCSTGVVSVKLPRCSIHYSIQSMFSVHNLKVSFTLPKLKIISFNSHANIINHMSKQYNKHPATAFRCSTNLSISQTVGKILRDLFWF